MWLYFVYNADFEVGGYSEMIDTFPHSNKNLVVGLLCDMILFQRGLVYTVNYASKKWGEGLKQGKLNGREGKNEKERYSWQWAKKALLYFDLLHSFFV